MRARSAALLLCLLGALALPTASVQAAVPDGAGRFIVTLRDSADARGVAAEYRRQGAQVDFVYTAALNGFAGEMSKSNVSQLQSDRRVTRLERDGVARAIDTQSGATWGLDRVDQRPLPLDTSYTYNQTGAGVTAYIVDTGIRYSHAEFGGRAAFGYDAFGGVGSDCNGHGSHVAGTVGGAAYGVAKATNLVAVRVLDCGGSGTWSGVIAGLDWVVADHDSGPAVANMSLGGGANSSVDEAVKRAHADGVAVVVAAGNGNSGGKEQDACNYSPARVPEAVTIGATTKSDSKTSWSNYGSCVDFFAPGASITSAWYDGDSATKTISGTSMAAPHVAGAAALYLETMPGSTATGVRDALYAATTKGIVTSSKTANNHLLYALVAPTSTGSVEGTVSSDGGAVSGATVKIGGKTKTTDSLGAYLIADVATGAQTVEVTATGFNASTTTVEVMNSTTVTHDVTLTAESAQDEPADGTTTIALEVTAGPKAKGVTPVTSSWTDSDTTTTSLYDVYVNGSLHKAGLSGTSETTHWRGSGSLTYKVCRAGAQTSCSSEATITI